MRRRNDNSAFEFQHSAAIAFVRSSKRLHLHSGLIASTGGMKNVNFDQIQKR